MDKYEYLGKQLNLLADMFEKSHSDKELENFHYRTIEFIKQIDAASKEVYNLRHLQAKGGKSRSKSSRAKSKSRRAKSKSRSKSRSKSHKSKR